MEDIKSKLLAANENGEFFGTLSTELRGKYREHEFLTDALVDLHNSGALDLIELFTPLGNGTEKTHGFFLLRNLFGETLLRLHAPVAPVLECISNLLSDGPPGEILYHYIDYCAAEVQRPMEALSEIEDNIDQLKILLGPTIEAGSQIDLGAYVTKAIDYTKHDNIDIRRLSLYTLGNLRYNKSESLAQQVSIVIEDACSKEVDDLLLSNLISASFSLYENGAMDSEKILAIVRICLEKGDSHCLYSVSNVFGFERVELFGELTLLFLENLLKVKPEQKETIDGIDFGLQRLLKKDGGRGQVIDFLEKYIIDHQLPGITKLFDNLSNTLIENKDLLDHLLTKWFLDGESNLCMSALELVKTVHHDRFEMSVDVTLLANRPPVHHVFLAHKIIGYLIFIPVTAASLLLSLIPLIKDDELVAEVISVLVDPLLINYPGTLRPYLNEQLHEESSRVRDIISEVLKQQEEYFTGLETGDKITELQPYQSQREAYQRREDRRNEEIAKGAQEKSIFASIFTSVWLLYGKKAITYCHTPDGQTQRQVMPMQHHSHSIELPRTDRFDPFGLDYALRCFRAARLKR